jgi:S-adenosylmethionine hydrolase
MIVLACDFGLPYTGQMRARLYREAPAVPVVELFTDLPAWDVEAAAHLIAAFAPDFPEGSVFCCVVDPGVGSARDPLVVEAGGRRFVGPDNGLFSAVIRKAAGARAWRIDWRPAALSASFHGRDLFAPIAARLWRDEAEGSADLGPAFDPAKLIGHDWPATAPRVIYIDGFGNAMTGLEARALGPSAQLTVAGRTLPRARTFADLAPGTLFWYENAVGLAEVAQTQDRAADTLNLTVGTPVDIAS